MTRQRRIEVIALGNTQRLRAAWFLPNATDLMEWSVKYEALPGILLEVTYKEWELEDNDTP